MNPKRLLAGLAMVVLLTSGVSGIELNSSEALKYYGQGTQDFRVSPGGNALIDDGTLNITNDGEAVANFSGTGIDLYKPLSVRSSGPLSVANGIELTGTSSNTIESLSTFYLSTSSGSASDIVLDPTGQVGVDSNLETAGNISVGGNQLDLEDGDIENAGDIQTGSVSDSDADNEIDFNSNRLTGLKDPNNEQDAATQSYVNSNDDTIEDNQGLEEVLSLDNKVGGENINFNETSNIQASGTNAITLDNQQNIGIPNGNLNMTGDNITNFFDQNACGASEAVKQVYPNGTYVCTKIPEDTTAENLSQTLSAGSVANRSIDLSSNSIENTDELGFSAKSNGPDIEIGSNVSDSSSGIIIGEDTKTSKGVFVSPTDTRLGGSVTIGEGAKNEQYGSVAIGGQSEASVGGGDPLRSTVAVGSGSKAKNAAAVAVGAGASTSNNGAVALGQKASTSAGDSVAIGARAQTQATKSIAIGSASFGDNSGAVAQKKGSVAIGYEALAQNRYEAAFGNLNGEELDVNVTGNLTVHQNTDLKGNLSLNNNNINQVNRINGQLVQNLGTSSLTEVLNEGNKAENNNINMSGNRITNLSDPTNPQDAATKNYVDTTDNTIQDDQTLRDALSLNNKVGGENINFNETSSIQASGTNAITLDANQNVGIPNGNLSLDGNNINNIGGLQSCGDNEFVDGNGNCQDAGAAKTTARFTSTDTSTDINKNSWTVIPWNLQLDISSGYTHDPSGSPGQITFEESGTYKVHTMLTYSDGSSRTNPGIKFSINGNRRDRVGLSGYTRNREGHDEASNYLTEMIDVNAGDTLRVESKRFASGGTSTLIDSASVLVIQKVSETVPKADDVDKVDGFDAADLVNKAGDTMTGNLNMNSNEITGLSDPTDPQDAATRSYVNNNADDDVNNGELDNLFSGSGILTRTGSGTYTTTSTSGGTLEETLKSGDSTNGENVNVDGGSKLDASNGKFVLPTGDVY